MTHESTGFSQAELVHGKNLRTPETFYEKWIGEEPDLELVTRYVFNLIDRLKRCRELTIENMVVTRDKIKIWYDTKVVERQFIPGDEAFVLAILTNRIKYQSAGLDLEKSNPKYLRPIT